MAIPHQFAIAQHEKRFTVVGLGMSTCARRVLTALEEKGASDQYHLQPVDFQSGQHKSAHYLETQQPFGQIPVLHDGNFKVYESRAICRYVDDVIQGGHTLVPRDPQHKALVEQWISVEMSHYKPAETLVYELLFKRFRGLGPDATVVEENRKKLGDFYHILNAQLEGKNYLVGDSFTLADLVFLPYTQYLLQQEGFADVLVPYHNVHRWWQTISSRPSWQKVSQLQ